MSKTTNGFVKIYVKIYGSRYDDFTGSFKTFFNFSISHPCIFYVHIKDLFLDQLTQRIQQLDEQIALYDAQCSVQAQETKAVREAVTEASMELEVRLIV